MIPPITYDTTQQVTSTQRAATDDIPKSIEALLQPNPFVLAPNRVKAYCKHANITADVLLKELISYAKNYARPPISNYHVGIAGLGESGTIYLGVNLEFLQNTLNNTLHGEQFFLINARNHGETGFTALALSAAPCGHCRQFFNEIGKNNHMQFLIPGKEPMTLEKLLPYAFGPEDLFSAETLLEKGKLLKPLSRESRLNPSSNLYERASQAAHESYAIYTNDISGVAIQMHDGSIYSGSYIENAAFNPTVSPMIAALVDLVIHQGRYEDIKEVVLAEERKDKVSQSGHIKQLLHTIAPHAEFTHIIHS